MRPPTRFRAVAGAAALTIGLTGCAADEDDGDEAAIEQPTDEDTDEDADEADGDAAATDTVRVRDIDFDPADIEVTAGTTVTWVNEDVVDHTVTSGPAGDPDGLFDEELASEGEDATVTFGEAGTFVYHCDLHRNMVGSVTVTG
jgi:plastocyanin